MSLDLTLTPEPLDQKERRLRDWMMMRREGLREAEDLYVQARTEWLECLAAIRAASAPAG